MKGYFAVAHVGDVATGAVRVEVVMVVRGGGGLCAVKVLIRPLIPIARLVIRLMIPIRRLLIRGVADDTDQLCQA